MRLQYDSGTGAVTGADPDVDGVDFAVNLPADYDFTDWTVTGDAPDRVLVDPSGQERAAEEPVAAEAQLIEIADDYAGARSHQPVAADLNLGSGAGKDAGDSAFLSAGMFNVLGDALTKTANYLAGVIGAYSITDTQETGLQAGGVVGVVMDGVTEADGAVVGVIDGGDPSSVTRANAVFAGRMNNNNAASGVDYGLDLHDAGRSSSYYSGGGKPLQIANADLRLSNEVCFISGDGAPVNYTDGTPPGTGEGFAQKGSLYTDYTNGKLYINTGSKTQPAWTVVGAQTA
jgi:hypothetical protein